MRGWVDVCVSGVCVVCEWVGVGICICVWEWVCVGVGMWGMSGCGWVYVWV